MATVGSRLITKEMEWNANMTTENHLGAALMIKPHQFMGVMDRLFSAEHYYSDNPLTSQLLGSKVTEETINGMEWEWQLQGANVRPLVVVENLEPSGGAGRYRRTFRLKLDENWFLAGDVLNPGTADKKFQVRVMDNAQRHGDGWVYTVRILSDDDNAFIPDKYLQPGSQWSKLYSAYGEAAENSGSTTFAMPISLRNSMTKLRKQYKITDFASTDVLAVGIQDSTGKVHQSWIRYAEVEYFRQWARERDNALWFGRKATTIKDQNGEAVCLGPGLQEQLEDGHIYRYTHLTAKLIEEYLMDIYYGRMKPGQGRNIKAFTGEYGMLQFHRAMQEMVNSSGLIKNIEVFANKTSNAIHSNSLEVGYQFVKYNMANGASLELIHTPLYDDRTINNEIDPITGYPLMSQRITFLDFAGEGKSSNIKIMRKKDGYAFTYVCGRYGPYGPTKSTDMAAHAGDYYEMHISDVLGIHVHDVTRCGELILSRN